MANLGPQLGSASGMGMGQEAGKEEEERALEQGTELDTSQRRGLDMRVTGTQ